MNTSNRGPNRTPSNRAAAVVGLLALTLTLSSPVLAGHRGSKHGHYHHPHAGAYRQHARPVPRPAVRVRTVVVPTVIRPAQVPTYRPYYRGQVFYAPHGHVHTVYSFPVWQDRAVAYETRSYCRGGLFIDTGATVVGPRFSLHVSF